MTTEQQMRTLFAEANPIPDADAFVIEEMAGATYLATLEQRSSEVIELEPRQEESTDKNSPRRWLAAAVVVAVMLGVGWAILGGTSEEVPVVTEPTPSTVAEVTPTTAVDATPTTVADETPTTLPDPRVDEGMAVAASFIEAYANFDESGLEEAGLVGQPFVNLVFDLGGTNVNAESARSFAEVVGLVRTVDGCELSNVNAVGINVLCTVLHETSFTNALGVDPVPFEIALSVRFEGESLGGGETMERTAVVERRYVKGTSEFQANAWGPLVTWIEERYPADADDEMIFNWQMFGDEWAWGIRPPQLRPESLALWSEIVAEFNAEQGQ